MRRIADRVRGGLRRAALAVAGTGGNRRRVEWLAHNLGYDVVPRTWISPIPNPAAIDPGTWERRSELPGLPALDVEAQLAWLESELSPYLREFRPPAPGADVPADRYRLDNPSLGAVDAAVLHAMVRRHEPARIIEVGSGFTTLVVVEALAGGGRASPRSQFTSIDPAPPAMLDGPMRGYDLRAVSATEVPMREFERLGSGDMLILDTSHSVKVGGEVNYLVLDVLPRLASGVLVHVHDVFLPWEYPRTWIERGYYWSEQYLLQAFLAFNSAFRVLYAAHLVTRSAPERVRALVPALGAEADLAASFWMERE